MVPDDWKIADFKDLNISTIDGDRGKNYPKKEGYLDHGYCLFLGADNVINGVLSLEKSIYISKENHEVLRKGVIQNDDILLVMRGNGTGRSCIFNDDKTKSIVNRINSGLAIIRADKTNVDVRYLHQLLQSSVVQKQFESFMFGSAQPQLTIQILKTIILPAPKLKEQKIIASILSTWDKAIETTEKLIENSKAQKKALMQQLLTGKRRFSGLNGKWHEVQLSSIANITMGSSPRSDAYNNKGLGLPLIQGNADVSNRVSRPRIYTSQITKECSVNDIIFSVRAPVGLVAISRHHACIGRGIAAINAKPSSTTRFIYQLLLSHEVMWKKLSQGSTFDAVNSADIKKLHVCVPSDRDEQSRIAKVLDHQDNLTGNLLNQLGILRRQKKALMQQLLTGKRRVKVDNQRTTEVIA